MSEEPRTSALEDVFFGSVAGMAAKVFEHPFDLIKVRLQSQPTDRALQFAGPLDCFKQTYSREGWRGLYRGISAPIVGAACENATLFLAYKKCQEAIMLLRHGGEGSQGLELDMQETAIAAAGAGTIASFVLTPIELIKCRMQVQMLAREGALSGTPSTSAPVPGIHPFATTPNATISHKAAAPRFSSPLGPVALIFDTIRQSGVRGLWLGQTGTLLRETGGSAAWFSAYEYGARHFIRRHQRKIGSARKATKADLTGLELMASGAFAGVSYNVILFPADSIKSTMQTSAELNPHKAPPGFFPTAKDIWRARGIRGMYAGCGLTVLRSAPSSAMIFYIYTRLESEFGGFLR
ncbi:hypothetical protein L202_03517 [Cryptococcus amylolentus CBS 6039]|uniref:Mitochondrial ornithine carrier protein n=2 Tax=Cryptococcus amylolentus TaxID=104669 RepID=A0A1E3HT77_9TREE|nr:hypothetical protein L202_03517 [Cryptococcus amylolentus CBS 6039]ODN79563.1 hypothetical protein L202_03517 [Cryptococcus amylolentus CBS 6039]ODO07896.1 hypothetical protein I350_03477 [Cryptococcus amylolentus CBS 6273]